MAYEIGPLTMEYVFKRSGLENVSDMQAVFNAVEEAFEDTVAQTRLMGEALDRHEDALVAASGRIEKIMRELDM